MTILDIAAIIIAVVGIIQGWRSGMVKMAAFVIALVLAVVGAILLYQPVSLLIQDHISEAAEPWLRLVVFIGLFILINWLVNLLGERLRRLARSLYLESIDKVGGAVLGGIVALLLLALGISVAANFRAAQEWLLESRYGHFVLIDLRLPALVTSPEIQQRLSLIEDLIDVGLDIMPDMSMEDLRRLLGTEGDGGSEAERTQPQD